MKKYDVYVGGNYVGTQEFTFEEVRKINENSDIVLITKQQSKLGFMPSLCKMATCILMMTSHIT